MLTEVSSLGGSALPEINHKRPNAPQCTTGHKGRSKIFTPSRYKPQKRKQAQDDGYDIVHGHNLRLRHAAQFKVMV